MLRDDIRELRRVADQALRMGEECWPVLPDGSGAGDSETFRRIIAKVNQPSGVTSGDATFTVDNVRPICGGVNPAASTADGVNITVNDAKGSYSDNAEIYAEWDNDNSEWIDVTDQGSEQYRRVIARVNNVSGVTAGAATFTVDNVRPISSGLNPVASTADGVNLTANDAKQAYADNAVVYLEWDNDNSEWIDVTDVAGGGGTVYATCDATSVANGSSGSFTLQTSAGGTLTAGSSVTAHNKTGKYIWQNSICSLWQAPDGAYHVVETDSCYVIRGLASGDSDYANSYASFGVGTLDPLLGTQAPSSVAGVSNPYTLRVVSGDNVTVAHDAGSNTWILLRSASEPKYFSKIGKPDSDIPARSGTTVGKGTVSVYEIDTADDGLDDTTVNETWYNLADVAIASGSWIMAKPVQAASGDPIWVIDWEQCT